MKHNSDIIGGLFGGAGRTAVLRVLAEASGPLTGRRIARLAGLSHSGANRALEHLATMGVVTRRAVGPALVNELDRDAEVVHELLLPALDAEQRIAAARRSGSGDVPPDIILRLVEGFDPVRVILFGSRARGEADESSDFDLLVVLPELADKHATMVAMLVALAEFAVPVDIVPTDVAEVAERGDTAGSVLAQALAEVSAARAVPASV